MKRMKDKLNKVKSRDETRGVQAKTSGMKKSVKDDKRNDMAELASEAETTTELRNMKELYNISLARGCRLKDP